MITKLHHEQRFSDPSKLCGPISFHEYFEEPFSDWLYGDKDKLVAQYKSIPLLIFITLTMITFVFRSNNKIKLIQLSRNYGHHRAMYAGIQHSKGELIFLIDSDLQEQPEAFPDFYNLLSLS